jgi:hypothetical protein
MASVDLRTAMPATAQWVQERRQALGEAHVNRCLREGLGGVPGRFYAIEAGFITGTPFPASHPIADHQRLAVVVGARFAGFIAHARKRRCSMKIILQLTGTCKSAGGSWRNLAGPQIQSSLRQSYQLTRPMK